MKDLIPHFETKAELFAHLKANKKTIIAAKSAVMKTADPFSYQTTLINSKGAAVKAESIENDNPTEVKVRAIINTTNYLDSHNDVHVKGIWNKSVKENKSIMHLQEHQMAFDKIISDGENLKAYTKDFTWKELGFDYKGNTEALVFDSTVTAKRNAFMFGQYRDGNVKNHSVGMRYIKMELAIDSEDEDFKEEKDTWDTYYPLIANKEAADGHFWVIKEAKIIEGSAVPIGSNPLTPTLENIEAAKGTSNNEPPVSTQQLQTFYNKIKF